MTSEEYGQYIDDFELGADVMPGESLTDYIERRRREFESKADGGAIGIEVLFGPKVPAAPSQLVEESEIVLGYRGDDAARSDRASGRSAGRVNPGGGVDRSAVGEGSQYAKNVAAQNNKPSFKKKVKSVVTNPVVQALGGALLTGGINLAAPGALEKLNKARMISNAIKYGKDIAIEDEIESIPQTGGISPYADGGRVGLFMGGPALEGQALQIYNSMKGYNFSDQEIADALSARGLYTPAGSGTTTQPEQVTGIIGAQLNQGDDGPKGDFGLFGDLDKSTAKEFNVEVYDEELGDFIPTTLTGYQNVKSGLFQTKEGKNIQPLFSNTGFTPGFLGALSNMLGLNKTVGGFKPGSIRGKYDGIRDIFNKQKKQQEDIIKQQQEKAKKEREARAAIAAAEMQQRNRDNKTGGYQFGYSPTSDFMTGGSSRPGGGSYGGGADLSSSMGSFKRGGLATMFTRRR